MYIEFRDKVNLTDKILLRGERYSFLWSPKELPYLKFQNIQLILFPTGLNITKNFTYIHLSFNHSELKRIYTTTYYMFKLGTEIKIPNFVRKMLNKEEKKFLDKVRRFVLNYPINSKS